LVALAALLLGGCGSAKSDVLTITNVSYDPTREFYEAYNPLFEQYYEENYGEKVKVVQSHGGSSVQARSVVEGSNADVVTLALEHDISLIERNGLIDSGWQQEFDKDSAPYTSTIVFLVRKGNPKHITDWEDLVNQEVEIITPDPKSSGGACWNFLAALSYAKEQYHDETKELEFLTKLYSQVSVMDSGARGSTTTFVENAKGDVLIAWENEAITTMNSYPGEYELITPSVSILAQPSVAIVDDNANINGTQEVCQAYLQYLYSDEAQNLVAEYGYRPSNETILAKYSDRFNLDVKLYSIEDYGGWDAVYETYFDDGAIFDEIYGY
jgi:sulfate transport system substrate-binding protein